MFYFSYRDDSTFVDIRELDLGHVCHHDIANDTDTDANKVIVEAAVRATRSSSLAAGDVVYLTSSAMINDQILAVTQVNLSLVLTEDFNETDHDTVIYFRLISASRRLAYTKNFSRLLCV